jgi:16S rRNA (guanine1207-N2)-methyltransferase
VFNAWPGLELPGVAPECIRAVQPMAHQNAALVMQGIKTTPQVNNSYGAVILKVPREKARALTYLKDAVRRVPAGGSIIVDGQKTDGIESLLKLCRERYDVREVVSKAHGKLFRIQKRKHEDDVMNSLDLPEPTPGLQPSGFYTAPGVFSADGPDPASVHLANLLPPLEGRVADLGAGWGYLSCRILETGALQELHLVEADWLALACAKKNVVSEAARYHWADVTEWKPEVPLDTVVTNPPFHSGRAADPELGREFIRAAAEMLTQKGSLWLVANRHLPYESTLAEAFRDVREVGRNPAFKVFCAERPRSR